MATEKVALWIDEEQRALDTYHIFLEDCFGEEVTLAAELPQNEIGQMVDRILNFPGLVALVLDQRLKSTGIATYTGIELAEAVRRTDTKLPVYILTNHADDIGELGYQVEYVLQKDNLFEKSYLQELKARVRRHLNVYKDIVSDREIRFEELLRKSLETKLSKEERAEFTELDFWRNKATLAQEESWSNEMKEQLDRQQATLNDLRNEILRTSEGE